MTKFESDKTRRRVFKLKNSNIHSLNSNLKFQISNYDNKLIVILGPTASGKTDLSVTLAKKFGGQIVSADSRQVYKGLDIGSGKITKKQMRGVPHHLLDVASPRRRFSVAQYQRLALRAIKKIQRAECIPFLVGGTGFYIQSVVDGIVIPEVKPDWKLRKKLESKSPEELFLILKKLDPARAKSIDKNNPRRLVRAIEIIAQTKKPIQKLQVKNQFDVLQIGIKKSPDELKKLIHTRLVKRIKKIISEVKKLHKNGLSFKRLEELGLEYRFVARLQRYAQHCGQAQYQTLLKETIDKIQKESEHYAKRQMTWFSAHGGSASGGKRDKRIHWVKNQKEAEKLIKKSL